MKTSFYASHQSHLLYSHSPSDLSSIRTFYPPATRTLLQSAPCFLPCHPEHQCRSPTPSIPSSYASTLSSFLPPPPPPFPLSHHSRRQCEVCRPLRLCPPQQQPPQHAVLQQHHRPAAQTHVPKLLDGVGDKLTRWQGGREGRERGKEGGWQGGREKGREGGMWGGGIGIMQAGGRAGRHCLLGSKAQKRVRRKENLAHVYSASSHTALNPDIFTGILVTMHAGLVILSHP